MYVVTVHLETNKTLTYLSHLVRDDVIDDIVKARQKGYHIVDAQVTTATGKVTRETVIMTDKVLSYSLKRA